MMKLQIGIRESSSQMCYCCVRIIYYIPFKLKSQKCNCKITHQSCSHKSLFCSDDDVATSVICSDAIDTIWSFVWVSSEMSKFTERVYSKYQVDKKYHNIITILNFHEIWIIVWTFFIKKNNKDNVIKYGYCYILAAIQRGKISVRAEHLNALYIKYTQQAIAVFKRYIPTVAETR